METKTKLGAVTLVMSLAGLLATTAREGGFKQPYLDPVGIVTMCAGHTRTASMALKPDEGTCTRLLDEDTSEAQRYVRKYVKVTITQRQYDELVDFTFNVGGPAFKSSTLLKKINAGSCVAAGEEFLRWNKAKGRVLRGLTARREQNRAGWLSGC